MGKLILYIAVSLDGYIADQEGKYAFLNDYSDPSVFDFDRFIQQIGTLIMGRKTYQQMLDTGEPWNYPNHLSYVYTTEIQPNHDNIRFTNLEPEKLLNQITSASDKDIWLFGGSQIIKMFLDKDLIDEYWIYYVPEILGDGIPLFQNSILGKLKVISTKQFDNIVEMKLASKR